MEYDYSYTILKLTVEIVSGDVQNLKKEGQNWKYFKILKPSLI